MGDTYKKHLLDADAIHRPNGRWGAEVLIYREDGNTGTDTRFIIKGDYETKQQAVSAAIVAGKKQIDKGYDDSVAVQDLDPNL
jgi:hypothetical protein